MGFRIFQEVTEGAAKKLKNQQRREKRSARRQIERKAYPGGLTRRLVVGWVGL
jgi:hypothetical protein